MGPRTPTLANSPPITTKIETSKEKGGQTARRLAHSIIRKNTEDRRPKNIVPAKQIRKMTDIAQKNGAKTEKNTDF